VPTQLFRKSPRHAQCYHRPHTALNGLTPMAALVNNVSGNHIEIFPLQHLPAPGLPV
jgi:hypothetical protein